MKKLLLTAGLLIGLFASLLAQTDLSQSIPVDSQVKIGKLENGMTYYIRKNSMPAQRVEMRLVVNAGSILEDDEQQGLAHFVEHMAFNGTANFSKSALIDFLERAGVRFGADLNAYTSFDETVYMLQLPTDRKGLVDSAFMVMEDWAHQVAMESEEIDKERGVIREEWRLGLGADDRMRKKYFPVIFNGSKYAERLPIGKVGVIDTAAYETLRRFYKEWYRPNLQAIIVTGDLEPALVESKIQQHFAHIQNPSWARERTGFEIPGNKEPLIAITTDPEATSSSVMMFYKHPKKEVKNLGDYKLKLMQSLYSSMIISRLNEINQKPNSPFVTAYTYYGGFIGRASDAYASNAVVKQNQIEKALETLIVENERVRQHGFTEPEFERQKKQLIANLEKRQKEKDKTPSASFVREYTNHFLSKSPIPGIDKELELTRELLPLISLAEINALAGQWITEENMVIVVTAPEKEDVKVPTENVILEVISQAKKQQPEAYVDSFNEEPLLKKPLKNVAIKELKTNDNLGIHSFELPNGVKVVVKPTDFKNDEILMTAFGPGGTSVFEDEWVFAANNTPRLVSLSGLGNFNAIDLGKKLTGQNVSVQPFMDEFRHGLSGNVSPKDFETMLQLIYLHFEPARRDYEAFEAFKSQLSNRFKFLKSNPQAVFSDSLTKIITSGSQRSVVIPNESNMASLQADVMYDMYNRLFDGAGQFTFIFTGNVDLNNMKDMIAKYLGNLPQGTKHQWIDRKVQFPDGITDARVHAGTEYKSMVAIVFKENFDYNDDNLLKYNLLSKAYNIKLRENMREEIGGVYGVGARMSASRLPSPKANVSVSWGTNPDLVDTLSTVVFDQMKLLMTQGPTAEDLAKVKETTIRERETDDKQNRFWLNYIDNALNYQLKMVDYETYRKQVEAVSIEDLKKTAEGFLNPGHYVRVALYPEEKK